MVVVGIDPSNAHTGLASVRAAVAFRDRLVDARAVTMLGGDDGVIRSVVERLHPVLDGWLPREGVALARGARIYVEQAPPTARKDTGHGAQAEIGFAQGWLAGAITSPWFGRCPVRRVGPSPWRAYMLVEAAREGLLLPEPGRKNVVTVAPGQVQRFTVSRDGVAYDRTWAGCGHQEHFETFGALHAAQAARCPGCEKGVAPARGQSEAEAVREAWKATACRFVAHFWPGIYEALCAPARERAHTNPPDHRLAGVSDACEAVGVALFGLSEAT